MFARQALVLTLAGVMFLPDEPVDLIKDKAAGDPGSNAYCLRLGVNSSRTTLERSHRFDEDAAIAVLQPEGRSAAGA